MLRVSTCGATSVRNFSSTPARDEPGRIQDHNVAAFGTYHAIPAKFPQHPYDYLPRRPHGIGQLLLSDRYDDLGHRLTVRSTLCGEVEQMSCDTLRTVVKVLPGISSTKLSTRSLSSLRKA